MLYQISFLIDELKDLPPTSVNNIFLYFIAGEVKVVWVVNMTLLFAFSRSLGLGEK
jgi:hypothetical protein